MSVQPCAIAVTTRPILYSFRRCPYAMRARLALLASEMVCEIREVKLSAKPEAMIAASPKATVPVLILPDGEVIDESLDIMTWALERHDPSGWLTDVDDDLIAANDGPFKYHLDRYKYPDRHGANSLEHRTAGFEILCDLEAKLKSSANLCGDAPRLADAALMPFVRQFAETDRGWFDGLPLPGVRDWLARHIASQAFEDVMIRLKPWQPADMPILFPGGCPVEA